MKLNRRKGEAKKDPKKDIVELLEQLGFTCVSHSSSLYKKIYVKDNLAIHVEEKSQNADDLL